MNESGAIGVSQQPNPLLQQGERNPFSLVGLQMGRGAPAWPRLRLTAGASLGAGPFEVWGVCGGRGGQPGLGQAGPESVHPHDQTHSGTRTPTLCGPTRGVRSGRAPA